MHLYAFIAILVPKLVAMVTPLCSLCTGVSQMNSTIPQTLSHNQTLHQYDAYICSCVHFTGNIARSATCRYSSYSEADFQVFRPSGATRCTDGVKFVTEEGAKNQTLHGCVAYN